MDVRGHGETDDPIGPALVWLQEAVAMAALRTRRRALQAGLVACTAALLLWTSCFLYASFLYAYMPTHTYSTALHLYYRSDCDSSSSLLCSFPTANVSLLRNGKHQVMSRGQPYCISLVLEMPESPANQDLGMFMVWMRGYSRGGRAVTSSRRLTMLRYRSGLVRALSTVLQLPFLLSGLSEQRQMLHVQLYSDYVDDAYSPVIGAVIEIQSDRVQIYSSHLYIHSHYSGIRYLLFNFPLMSAFVGVASIFGVLSVLASCGHLRRLWGQICPRPQTGDRSGLRHTEESQMNRSETEYSEDDQDHTAEMETSSSAHQDPLHLKTSHQDPLHLKTAHQEPLHLKTAHQEPLHLKTAHQEPPLHLKTSHQDPFHLKTSDLNQEESILQSDFRQRRARNGTMGETIPEGGVESRGIPPDSELEEGGLSDLCPPPPGAESCVTS